MLGLCHDGFTLLSSDVGTNCEFIRLDTQDHLFIAVSLFNLKTLINKGCLFFKLICKLKETRKTKL